MSSIFKPFEPRQQVMWTPKEAYVFSGEIDDSMAASIIPGSTFTVTIAGGTPVVITTIAYADVNALKTDLQSQLDIALGGGVALVFDVEDQSVFIFDLSGVSVEISGVSTELFQNLPFANQNIDTNSTTDTLVCNPNSSISLLNAIPFPLNTISDLVTIPSGAAKLSLWVESVSEDLNLSLDGYNQNIAFAIGFTNGVDGSVVDGYFSEIATESKNTFNSWTEGTPEFVGNGVFVTNFANIHLTSGVNGLESANRGNYKTTDVILIDVPIGSTGMYFVGVSYQGEPAKSSYPPKIKVAVISGS